MSTTIDPAKYWQLRTLSADVDAAQAQLAYAQMRVEQTRKRRDAFWAALAAEYQLAPDRPYAANDDACTLTDQPTG
jgi:hypothetical protein